MPDTGVNFQAIAVERVAPYPAARWGAASIDSTMTVPILGLLGACVETPEEMERIISRLSALRRANILRIPVHRFPGRTPSFDNDLTFRLSCGALISGTHVAVEYVKPGENSARAVVAAFDGHLTGPVEDIDTPTGNPAALVCIAYRRWGVECFARLNGNYSGAIFDPDLGRLLVARDAAGTKPVFYSVAGTFVFGSSALEVLRASGRRAVASPRVLLRYLVSGRPDGQEETLLEGVRAIPASHCIEVVPGGLPSVGRVTAAIGADLPLTPRSFANASQELRRLLLETVRAQSSGTKVGVALSGGIDSSGLLACLREALGPTEPVQAFSFVHEHAALPAALNERPWAEMAASHVRATVRLVRLEAAAIPAAMSRILEIQDFPFSSPVVLAQAEVFRVAAESGFEAMLSGHGPDTLFGGGSSHIIARGSGFLRDGRIVAAWKFLQAASDYAASSPSRLLLSSIAQTVPSGWRSRLRSRPPWVHWPWFRDRIGVESEAPAVESPDPMRRLVLDQLFHSVIPTSMHVEECNAKAHGIDNRSPYLVPAILRLAGALPGEHLVADTGMTRPVVRNALAGLVPAPILERKHPVGFAVPVLPWLHELRAWVEESLGELRSLPFYRATPASEVWMRLQATDSAVAWETAFHTWRWISLLHWARANNVDFM